MFGNRLKELRKAKGFTQKEIAQMLDLKERTYKSYENNERETDSQVLVKIANLFDVSIDFLLDFDVKAVQKETFLDLSNKEVNLIRAYRNKPDMQKSVDILLGIAESPPSQIVQTKAPPKVEEPKKPNYEVRLGASDGKPAETITVETVEKILNAPDVDDDEL